MGEGNGEHHVPDVDRTHGEKRARDRGSVDGGTTAEHHLSLPVLLPSAADVLIAVAKTVAGLLTAAASMVAEAAPSRADAGNETFLMTAERRAARPPDAEHPTGYGWEAYVWSM